MKKIVSKVQAMKIGDVLAAFAMVFTVVGGNSFCTCIFHDVEKPDLTQFRKF